MFMVVVMLLICSVLHCLYSVGNKITTTTTTADFVVIGKKGVCHCHVSLRREALFKAELSTSASMSWQG